ncbi:MAG: phosphatase PAP2 family protein [Cytophagales bacterium]|nr:phosphatase PAP2 family protein [Cytophagales bacterium]
MFSLFHKLDKNYFSTLQSLNHESFGEFFLLVSKTENWIPLYLLLLYLVFKHARKNFFHIILFIGVILFVAGQITSGVLKNFFYKLNPYNSIVDLNEVMRTYVGKIGFVSAHSVQTFSVSTFLILVLGKKCKKIYFIFLWPILVCSSQCVLKIHNINDVCSGAVIGDALGMLFYFLFNRRRGIVKKILKYFVGANLFR